MILIPPLIVYLLLFGATPICYSSTIVLPQGVRLGQQQRHATTNIIPQPPQQLPPQPLPLTPQPIFAAINTPTAPTSSVVNNSSGDVNKTIIKEPDKLATVMPERKVCGPIHIRNNLKNFELLRGCTIIEGQLTIALVSNKTHPYEAKDYDNITFPELREITDNLIFFRVQGLSTLSKLFPNLAVIRGRRVVENYSFIIYEMFQLQEINLPSLSDILVGSVRIEKNPNLCHVTTVNWERICKRAFVENVFKDNSNRCKENYCPAHCEPWPFDGLEEKTGSTELGTKGKFCWNGSNCHEPCKSCEASTNYLCVRNSTTNRYIETACCSPQCAGGCFESNRPDRCVSCRTFSQEDKCVEECDSHLYELKGRCITKEECLSHVEPVLQKSCERRDQSNDRKMKPIKLPGDKHGRCQPTCPSKYEEDPDDKRKCKLCDKGKCRKVCSQSNINNPYQVTDVDSLKELHGCNVINGSLEISMKGGKNALHELKEAFRDLEEIGGYLKITRTLFLLTLGFLDNLKFINGSRLDRSEYALSIINNPNLQELFMFPPNKSQDTKPLTISNGKLFVHLNPKLCPHRIDHLKTYANVADWDEKDVSKHTNGDEEACNVDKLDVIVDKISPSYVVIKVQNYAKKMDDPRSLLSYLINYREAPSGNLTMFDGRDGCYGDAWTTIEEDPKPVNHGDTIGVVINVKAATRYALYVKTFTILAQNTGALSDIIYFTSSPGTPGTPRELTAKATSYDSITVTWSPPTKPNGIIEKYILTVRKLEEMKELEKSDVCSSDKDRERALEIVNENESKKSVMLPPTQIDNDGNTSPTEYVTSTTRRPKTQTSDEEEENKADSITFQDTVQDAVIFKNPCVNSTKSSRKKRAISSEPHSPSSKALSEDFRLGLPQSLTFEPTLITTTLPPSSTQTNQISQKRAIKFIDDNNQMQINISVSDDNSLKRFNYVIENLEHFTQYSVEVIACHRPFVSNATHLVQSNYTHCSIEAMTQVRTLAIEENDKILSETLHFIPANDTSEEHSFTWRKPERPNGEVLAYRIRYRPMAGNQEYWHTCITASSFDQNSGYKSKNISPGRYVLNIQAITMFSGSGYWSDPGLEFEIPDYDKTTPYGIGAFIIFFFVFVTFIVAYATCYFQKHKNPANGLLYASVNPDYIKYEADDWEVKKDDLIIGAQIGTGSFGQVFKGQLIKKDDNGVVTQIIECAIKTVPSSSTAKHRIDFLREASIMKEFNTYHIVKLFGVVSISTPVYVIMELMLHGDLKSYLRKVREKHDLEKKPLADGIYLMAAQIADGMAYLADRKFVHRDLAARNCLVGINQTVKIGDFGLARDIIQNEYYRRGTQARLPVRWMAPEALSDNIYTSASDVWSYGIVLWEIVTFSAYPYQGLSNDEVVKKVTSGQTLPRPDNCPNLLFNIMQKCWRKNPSDRPTFVNLIEILLPETDEKLSPDCFYKKQKTESNSIVQSSPEESINTTGTESYPLLSWPSTRTNGLIANNNNTNKTNNNIDTP